ncbi:MAG: ABC transporter permease [Candidatus Methanomethylophilus sp.]|nr:ABC transporter permease [Methanomethylophilus sp.]
MYRFAAYVRRDLLRWRRAPLNLFATMVMPAAWLVFMGLVMPVTYDGNYLDFVTPGILVMTVLTSGLAAGSSMMFDKELGYLNKFLALPAPRESILVGKIVFVTIRGLFQATVILIIALLIGATVQSVWYYLGTYLILMLFSVIIASLGATISLSLHDYDTYAAVQSMISMPLYFFSTSLVPLTSMPVWMRYIAECNPLSYANDAIRALGTGDSPWLAIGVLLVLAAVMLVVCGGKFRRAVMD